MGQKHVCERSNDKMDSLPELLTERLKLRPFRLEDAPDVAELCGAWEIADTTANIPHPYDLSMAEAWIGAHRPAFERGESVSLAITELVDGHLVGAIGLHIDGVNRSAEIGYWVGKPFWNRGYATEATKSMIAYGFEVVGLNRIAARHMTRNPASGRVMEKAGMKVEGILRQSIHRWERYEDAAIRSILREEYQGLASS